MKIRINSHESPSFNPLLLSRSTRKHPQIVPPGAPLGAPLGVPQGVPLGYPQDCKILQFFSIFQHFFNIFQYPIVKSYNWGGTLGGYPRGNPPTYPRDTPQIVKFYNKKSKYC